MAKILYPRFIEDYSSKDETLLSADSGMRWTIDYSEESNYVRVVIEGRFNALDHLKMIEDIISRDFWQPGIAMLTDDRLLSFEGVSLEIIQKASDNRRKYEKQIGSGRVAILVNSLTGFARGRQYQLLTEDNVSAQIRVFMNEEDAVGWLIS